MDGQARQALRRTLRQDRDPNPTADPAASSGGDRESALRPDGKREVRLWLRLLSCSALIEKQVRAKLRADFQTTLPRFDVLAQLDRVPAGLTMGELSDRLMVSAGNVTGLVERLVREGLVSRAASARDRRTQRVGLTPTGKRAFDKMAASHHALVEELMAGMAQDDIARLIEMLGMLKETLKQEAS